MDRSTERLEELFEQRILLRPSDEEPNLVHLVRAMAGLSGVEHMNGTLPIGQLAGLIGDVEHIVFVLLDGLGMNLIRALPKECFLQRHLVAELRATSPSTTACALTSVATGEYPGRHGVTGWFTHLPEFGLTSTMLPFVERFTNQPLTERGITPSDVLPIGSFQPRMKRDQLTLLPYLITHTTYATWSRGGTAAHGYASYHHAVDLVIEHLSKATKLTYTHLYLPEVDTKCHHVGVDHCDVMSLVKELDAEMARLAAALSDRARIIITADHGLIDVMPENQTFVMPGDPLLELLLVPPSGDARLPVFHVKLDKHEQFVETFNERFGDRFILLDIDTVDRMRIFNPAGPLEPHAKKRFGDFVAIAYRPVTLAFRATNKPVGNLYIGQHAGLSPQEMETPLIIA